MLYSMHIVNMHLNAIQCTSSQYAPKCIAKKRLFEVVPICHFLVHHQPWCARDVPTNCMDCTTIQTRFHASTTRAKTHTKPSTLIEYIHTHGETSYSIGVKLTDWQTGLMHAPIRNVRWTHIFWIEAIWGLRRAIVVKFRCRSISVSLEDIVWGEYGVLAWLGFVVVLYRERRRPVVWFRLNQNCLLKLINLTTVKTPIV